MPTKWNSQQQITSQALNNIEDGVTSLDQFNNQDGNITDNRIDHVSFGKVIDSFANISSVAGWNIGNDFDLEYDSASSSITIAQTAAQDSGFQFPILLDKVPISSDILYLNLDFVTSLDSSAKKNIDVYLADANGNLISQIGAFTQNTSKTHYNLSINGSTLLNANIQKKFMLMFAIHDAYSLTAENIYVNWTNGTGSLSDSIAGIVSGSTPLSMGGLNENKFVASQWDRWDAIGLFAIQSDGSILYTHDSSSGARGIHGFTKGLDFTKPVYISFTAQSLGVFSFYWGKADGSIAEGQDLGQLNPNGNSQHYEFKISPAEFAALGITDSFFITIGGSAGTMIKIFNDISISNVPASGKATDAIKALNEATYGKEPSQFGQTVDKMASATRVAVAGIQFGTWGTIYTGSGAYIKNIRAYVKTDGNYIFKIATIDQHQLIVNSSSISVWLNAGYNDIDYLFKYGKTKVGNGQQIFMDLSSAGVYTPNADNPLYIPQLIQDSSHLSTDPVYTGNIMYSTNYLVPFNVTLIDIPTADLATDVNSRLSSMAADINSVSAQQGNMIVSSPSGRKFRISVDDNGNLVAVSDVPSKVAIFGNSLTLERGNIGMAASDQNHDWYHYVTQYILGANPNASINPRTSFYAWESATSSADRTAAFNSVVKPVLAADTGVVVIQLVDNINSDARHATFAQDVKTLITNIKSVAPNAKIYWVAGWFLSYPDLIQSIQAACADTGATFVDITPYNSDPSNKSYVGAVRTGTDGSSWTVSSTGEAAHPGDAGHQLIGQAVINQFGF